MGPPHCARVAGHLKEGPHADDHDQGTDHAEIAKRYHHTIESRFAIVQYATDHGMKGAARRFGLDRNTVRAWRRRWQAADVAGLVPRYPPIWARRIADSTVALIEHARRDLKYGAVRTRM
jgi:transposase-like protein